MKSIINVLRDHWQGAIIGGIVGLLLWVPQQCYTDYKESRDRTKHWCKSVINEIESNSGFGTEALHLEKTDNGHTFYYRYLTNSALNEFLEQEPNLSLKEIRIGDSARSLLELTILFNQLVDQRNMRRTVEAGGMKLGNIRFVLDTTVSNLFLKYNESSSRLAESLLPHI